MAILPRGTRSLCRNCQRPVIWEIHEPLDTPVYRLKPRWYHFNPEDPDAIRNCFPNDSEQGWKHADPVDYCTENLRSDDRFGEICNTKISEENRELGVCGRHAKYERERRLRRERDEFQAQIDEYVAQQLDEVIERWNAYYDLDAHKEPANYRTGRASSQWSGYISVNPGRLNDLIAKIEETMDGSFHDSTENSEV